MATAGGFFRATPVRDLTVVGETNRTLVLIHGWAFSRQVWQPLVSALGDLPVVRVDLPGHGDGPDGGLLADVRAAAKAVRQQLPDGIREPVWVGWSLGGLVALALAEQWRGPQRLALLCSTPRFAVGPGWPFALAASELAGFADELARDRRVLERRFAALCAHGARAPAALRRQLLSVMADTPATDRGLRAGLAALAQTDLRAVWGKLDAPLWAWLAEGDRLVPTMVHGQGVEGQGLDSVNGSPATGRGGAWEAGNGAAYRSDRDGAGTGLVQPSQGIVRQTGCVGPGSVAAGLALLRPDARLRVVPGGHASWLEDPAGCAGFLREVMQ